MADPNDRRDPHAPSKVHLGPSHKGKFAWLPWLLLALGLLALLFALSRCDRDEAVTPATAPADTAAAPAAVAPVAVDAREPAGVSQVGPYLASAEAASRTFVFERLNFDTASSVIRSADQPELAAVATTLNQYPNSRVRVVGYADARGAEPVNVQLGRQRADAVKRALVDAGVAADRIDTGSGGENAPVSTNATAPGRAENRRTELVILQR